MSKAVEVIKHELKEAVFPTIFFLIIFHLLIATKHLLLASYNITPGAVASALIGALIVAKSILIIDVLPISRHFMQERLIYSVIWRSFVYNLLVLLFRYLEELIPYWTKSGSFMTANTNMFAEFSWPHFLAFQMWMVVSIIAYSTITALDEHFGEGSMKRAIFGKLTAGSAPAAG